MPKKTWTDEMLDNLRTMHAAGQTHAEMAVQLGITTIAVTAKVKRMAGTVLLPRRKRRTAWTDELMADLRRMHASGMSFAMIADEMGMTRSAVIGKADRLGLSRRMSRSDSMRQHHHAKRFKPAIPTRTRMAPRIIRPPASPPKCVPISLMARTNGQCAYPVSDFSGPHEPFFCGAAIDEVEPIQSYCAWHRAIAMPPENQPRNRR